jgi:ribosome-binding factor A
MTVRTQQVASSIRAAVQMSIARGLNDPRIRGLISITRVVVAPDLSEAFIHVSVLPEEHSTLTLRGLESAAGHIRASLRDAVRLRKVPRLVFRLDESMKKQAKLDAAIRSGLPRGDDEGDPLRGDLHEDEVT